jgi:hypothetical protein
MHHEPLHRVNDEPSVLVAGSVPRFAGATKSPAAGAGAYCPAGRGHRADWRDPATCWTGNLRVATARATSVSLWLWSRE